LRLYNNILPVPSNVVVFSFYQTVFVFFNNKPPIYSLIINALESLAAVVNRVTCSVPVPGSTLYVHACHPRGALPAPGLAGCPVDRGE